MTKREIGFLLIGLGIGLVLSVVVIVEFVLWFHHMFILGIRRQPGSVLLGLPFLLIIAGSILLYHDRSKA